MSKAETIRTLAGKIGTLTEKAKTQNLLTMRKTLEQIADLQVEYNLLIAEVITHGR